MKESTASASNLIKTIALLILILGSITSIMLMILGIYGLTSEQAPLIMVALRLNGFLAFVYGIANLILHTLVYALLCGFAVIVENSDRTAIEDALFEIADNTRQQNYSAYNQNNETK